MMRILPDYARAYVSPRRIDPHLRERIQLRIARLNDCGTCTAIHTAAALDATAFDAEAYPEDVRAALRLATHLAVEGRVSDAEIVDALHEYFPDWAVRQIYACARVICWTNRFNRTWEGLLAWTA
jgi:AhpD family alkylhydroperoxidase